MTTTPKVWPCCCSICSSEDFGTTFASNRDWNVRPTELPEVGQFRTIGWGTPMPEVALDVSAKVTLRYDSSLKRTLDAVSRARSRCLDVDGIDSDLDAIALQIDARDALLASLGLLLDQILHERISNRAPGLLVGRRRGRNR